MTKLSFMGLLALGMWLQTANAQNTLTAKEKKNDWHLLFDGKTTTGWHSYNQKDAGTCWQVVDNALQLNPADTKQADLLTDGEYENFELSVEWKIAPGGNSGIIFGVHEAAEYRNTYDTGIEMQVLDNEKAEDRKKPNHLAGSLYDLKAPAKSVAKPAGEWNLAKIRKKDGQLTFWLNNTIIVETKIGSAEWEQLINNSKFKSWKGFAQYPKGHIALQTHGSVVAYRDIKIKEL
jgi:hypothetical protein